MKKRLNWFDHCKAAAEAAAVDRRSRPADRRDDDLGSLDDPTDTTWFDELKVRAERQHNQRATDSELTAAIAAAEPELVRAQFRKAIRRLEEFFEDSLDATGAQSGQNILARIHQITGERRRKYK